MGRLARHRALRTHLRRLLLCVLAASSTLLVGVGGAASAWAAAGDGVNLSPEKPTARSGPASAYFTWQLPAGGTTRNGVVATNSAATSRTFTVSAVDAFTANASGASYRKGGDSPADASPWITLSTRRITVPAHGRTVVHFTVRVPRGASPGDHLAGIALQSVIGTSSGSGPLQITRFDRSVIGALVQVKGPSSVRLAITHASLGPLPGSGVAAVSISLEDIGSRLARPLLAVRLQRKGYDRTVRQPLDTLLPGDPIVYPLRWPESLQPGDYTISVSLSGAGQTASFSDHVSLKRLLTAGSVAQAPAAGTRTDGSQGSQKAGSSGLSTGFVVGVAAATAAVVLALVALVSVLRRRSQRSAAA